MKNEEHEKLPDFIYEWLGQFSFEELTEAQRTILLKSISKEDYSELYFEYITIKSVIEPPQIKDNQYYKGNIMTAFDEKQKAQKKKGVILYNFQFITKIAAMLIMFGAGWLFHGVFNTMPSELNTVQTIIDTVFVKSDILEETENKTDSELDKIAQIQTPQRNTSNPKRPKTPLKSEQEKFYPNQDLSILSVNDLENNLNSPKGNSYKDDTLSRRYKLTSL